VTQMCSLVLRGRIFFPALNPIEAELIAKPTSIMLTTLRAIAAEF